MNQAKRNLFESCRELTEQHWRDWDHKTRYEWKLSFGYWAALLAMTAVVLKERIDVPVWLLTSVCLVALFLHLNFLRWIQRKLKKNRTEIFRIQKRMRKLVGVKLEHEPKFVRTHDKWWLQVSLWTQAGITCLLILLFIYSALVATVTPTATPAAATIGVAGALDRPATSASGFKPQNEPVANGPSGGFQARSRGQNP
jgi:hypothetical protein